jgi:hypothetical protein
MRPSNILCHSINRLTLGLFVRKDQTHDPCMRAVWAFMASLPTTQTKAVSESRLPIDVLGPNQIQVCVRQVLAGQALRPTLEELIPASGSRTRRLCQRACSTLWFLALPVNRKPKFAPAHSAPRSAWKS